MQVNGPRDETFRGVATNARPARNPPVHRAVERSHLRKPEHDHAYQPARNPRICSTSEPGLLRYGAGADDWRRKTVLFCQQSHDIVDSRGACDTTGHVAVSQYAYTGVEKCESARQCHPTDHEHSSASERLEQRGPAECQQQ